MINDFDDIAIAYSIGISDDVSWDHDMADRGMDIFQYDHTIDGLPQDHSRFHWEKTGIGPLADPKSRIDTLPNLIIRNGHGGRRDMVLKCDIEGGEWDVLNALPSETLDQFAQIVVETHDWRKFANKREARRRTSAVEKLTKHHNVVHVHANNFAPYAIVGGIPIADVMEITLLRKDDRLFLPSQELFPGALDQPCDPNAADLFVGSFVFE